MSVILTITHHSRPPIEMGNFTNECIYSCRLEDKSVSPVVRQVLLHWAYSLTQEHYDIGVKAVKQRQAKK